MLLSQLQPMSEVEINFRVNGRKFDFKSTITNLQIAPVYVNDVVIHLCSPAVEDLSIKWFNVRSERTHEWKPVMTFNNVYYLCVDCESREVNRRETIRIRVDQSVKCRISDIKGDVEATVRDISNTGVGVYVMHNISRSNEFNHRLFQLTLNNHYIEAECVRQEEVNDYITLCGCRIIKAKPDLGRYINQKQIQILRRCTM